MSRLALSCRWLSSACFSDTISSSMALVAPPAPSKAPAQLKTPTARSNQSGRMSRRAPGPPPPRPRGARSQPRRAMTPPAPRPAPHPQPPAVGPLPEGSRERGGAPRKPSERAPPPPPLPPLLKGTRHSWLVRPHPFAFRVSTARVSPSPGRAASGAAKERKGC